MSYIEAAFAAVPPEEWSGPPLTIGAGLISALGRSWPGPLPRADMRSPSAGRSIEERRIEADARCAAMWAARQGLTPVAWETLAARYGYADIASAQNAIRKWRRRVDEQAALATNHQPRQDAG